MWLINLWTLLDLWTLDALFLPQDLLLNGVAKGSSLDVYNDQALESSLTT